MSETNLTKHDHVLIGLFSSLQAAAMQQMGKIQNPMTGEIERDMAAAQSSIDILEMLKVKCRHDTPEDLVRFMDNSVMELQMNYLDEKKKDEAAAGQKEDAAGQENTAPEDTGDREDDGSDRQEEKNEEEAGE